MAQKKCAPYLISWTYADRLHTFHGDIYFLQTKNEQPVNWIYAYSPLVFCNYIASFSKSQTKFSPYRPALLFRKSIAYKRTFIISCYYYNISTFIAHGFKNRKSSVFFYISFRAGCFCLYQCFFAVLFSSTWIYILNILFLSKVIFTKNKPSVFRHYYYDFFLFSNLLRFRYSVFCLIDKRIKQLP